MQKRAAWLFLAREECTVVESSNVKNIYKTALRLLGIDAA